MTPTHYFSVLKKNGLCTVQDLGRFSAQHLGFTAGGAADEYAYLAANFIVGNTRNDAVLEVTLGQLTLQSHQHCTISVTGADCNATINNIPIKNWQAYTLKTNDILQLNIPEQGLHSYVAVHGGIQTSPWLASKSQSISEQSLSFGQSSLNENSRIPISSRCVLTEKDSQQSQISVLQPVVSAFYTNKQTYTQSNPLVLRFVPQKLWSALSANQQDEFQTARFEITPQSNRMGYRLSELPNNLQQPLIYSNTQGLQLSKPVTYGTIQLPSNSQPIVLMKERQTIGGYPVLGCVIQSDLFRLSQLRPGEYVRFTPASITFAQQQLLAIKHRFPI